MELKETCFYHCLYLVVKTKGGINDDTKFLAWGLTYKESDPKLLVNN